MFQANVNIDYRKAAVGITIAMLIATMFLGMVPLVAAQSTTPGDGDGPSDELIDEIIKALAALEAEIKKAYEEFCNTRHESLPGVPIFNCPLIIRGAIGPK